MRRQEHVQVEVSERALERDEPHALQYDVAPWIGRPEADRWEGSDYVVCIE